MPYKLYGASITSRELFDEYGNMVVEFLTLLVVEAGLIHYLSLVDFEDELTSFEGVLVMVLFFVLPAYVAIIRSRGRLRNMQSVKKFSDV